LIRSRTFWALVRHEYRKKGNWRRSGLSALSKWWGAVYLVLIAAALIIATTYFAVNGWLMLEQMWYVAFGAPYMMLFAGHGMIKREWENDSYGWWLALPYPRTWLVVAKWIAGWLRVATVIVAFAVLAILYAVLVAVCLPHYTWADVGRFLAVSGDWLALLAGVSPILLSMGQILATSAFTAARPVSPLLWVLFLSGMGVLQGQLGNWLGEDGQLVTAVDRIVSGWQWIPAIAVSWLAAGCLVRLSAFLIEKNWIFKEEATLWPRR